MPRFADRAVAAAGLWLATSLGVAFAAGPGRSVAYVPVPTVSTVAYLIDWRAGAQAHVAGPQGDRDGSVATDGTRRVITLDEPFSLSYYSADIDPCLHGQSQLRSDTKQIVVTTTSGSAWRGTSTVAEVGAVTTLDGCNAGHVEPFEGTGTEVDHVAMSMRPSVADLAAGVALAGPSEEPRASQFLPVGADVLTLQAGGLGLFSSSGHVVGAAFDAGEWLQLQLPGGGRAYSRIVVDRRTGAETWLDADWSDGRPTSVRAVLMVKPDAGASFGTMRQASRMWESAIGAETQTPFFIYLFQDGSGASVFQDLAAGTTSSTPLHWVFAGRNIVQSRILGTSTRERTWKPLLNAGRARFVMEDVQSVGADGTRTVTIPARVNLYTDTGPATPPAP